jgi:hypothetical protein
VEGLKELKSWGVPLFEYFRDVDDDVEKSVHNGSFGLSW